MNKELARTSTRLAHIELVEPGLVNVRFREGVVLDTGGMSEIIRSRLALQGNTACAVLMEWNANVEFNFSYMQQDHYRVNDAVEGTTCLAMVVRTELQERLLSLYFTYHAQPFPTRVFRERRLAMAWLDGGAHRCMVA